MHLLISGARGFIGSALTQRFTKQGHRVTTLVRGQGLQAPGSLSWDPARGQIDLAGLVALEPLDAVVHLSGAGIADKRWSSTRKDEILLSRTRSTEILASALSELSPHPGVLVSASAIGFYGNRGDEILTESSSKGTGFLADVCAKWEHATQPAERAGLRVAHLRTGIVLDPSGGALAKQLPLFKAGLGGKLGSGKQWMSWISLEDELGAIEHVIATDSIAGPVNLVAPQPVSNGEFTKTLAHALSRPSFASAPKAALSLALGSELVDEAITASQRVRPAKLEDQGFEFHHATLDEYFTDALR